MPATATLFDPEKFLENGGLWDDLVSRSRARSVFLSSAWLRAAWQSEHPDQKVLAVAVTEGKTLVAGAVFVQKGALLQFLGSGSSDYLDIVVDRSLSEGEATECVLKIFSTAIEAHSQSNGLLLRGIPEQGYTPRRLLSLGGAFWVTEVRSTEAPAMDMAAARQMLRKKSLRRHEKALSRLGKLEVVKLSSAAEVLPRLPEFFDLHIRRWSRTLTPSLFLDSRQRALYVSLVRSLGENGWLRFTEVRVDDRLAAAHFGMHCDGRFTWYKPAFEPELARFSPGEVLLKSLIEQAEEERAQEFDFTVGGEPFKKRFATHIRTVKDYHITHSRSVAFALRVQLACRGVVRSVLSSAGLWQPLKRGYRVLQTRRSGS